MFNVYLAGIIDGKNIEKCHDWRNQIINTYSNWKNTQQNYGDIAFLNPLNGETEISKDGLASNVPPKAILDKDYNAIKNSNLFIVNMETYGVQRPPIGTLMEIAFAYEFRIPIIMITTDNVYHQHPFVSNMVSWYFESVEEMIKEKSINKFYKSCHGDQRI